MIQRNTYRFHLPAGDPGQLEAAWETKSVEANVSRKQSEAENGSQTHFTIRV